MPGSPEEDRTDPAPVEERGPPGRQLSGGGTQIIAVTVGIAVMILMLGLAALAEFVLFRHPSPGH
jgi:hypothetical protein